MPTFTLEELLQPTADIMLRIANTNNVITYGNAANILNAQRGIKIFDPQMGKIVGWMMSRMLNNRTGLPPLNALMISATTNEPSGGADEYINKWLGTDFSSLPEKKRKNALDKAFRAVWAFDAWDEIYKATFGGSPVEIDIDATKGFSVGEYGGPAESDEHRRLRLAVQKHPSAFLDLYGQISAATEKRLLSGDEIDVYVIDDHAHYAVEVKSRRSSNADLKRGIYQAVKYRAVLKAEHKALDMKPKVRAVLIAERKLPNQLKALAKNLKVNFIFAPIK